MFENLRKFSFETTFGVDELASASTQLLNIGVSVDDLNGKLKMLGDLAQGDKNKFAELTSIYSKVLSTGKASAMQLQQFALRGIPIRQVLKDMGVEGAVSAETLTQAFQQLTEEGGRFHNAMGNIIDTIEGKRGFISDTLKEISVNFGEVTGLTKNYKKTLDALYEFLNKFNNLLMKINKNPVLKAVIEGTIATALGGLAGVIATSLVPVITTKLIPALGSLVTLVAANPWLLGIGLAVGATVGIINAVNNNRSETPLDKKKAEVDELADAYESAMKRIGTSEETVADMITVKQYEIAKLEMQRLQNSKTLYPYFDNEISKLQKELDLIRNINKEISNEKKEREEILNSYTEMIQQMNDEYNLVLDSAMKWYASTTEGKLEALKLERERIKNQLASPWEGYETVDDDGNKSWGWVKRSDKELEILEKRLNAINTDIQKINKELNKTSWQSWFQTVTGIKVTSNGKNAATEYMQNLWDLLYTDAKDVTSRDEGIANVTEKIEKLKWVINELKSNTNLDEVFTDKDGSIKVFTEGLQQLEAVLKELKENGYIDINIDFGGWDAINSIDGLVNKLKQKGMDASTDWKSFSGVGYYALGELINSGTELLNTNTSWGKYLTGFVNTLLSTGNIWMALISVAFQGLVDWISSVNEEEEKQVELLRKLNEQFEDLIEAQRNAEEYYLEQRRKLNANAYIGDLTRVNDMILTPQGNFSTSPKDYLIATKDPASLSGGMVLNVQIKNELGDSANVSVQQKQNNDGTNEMFILFSKKIASDFANGYNGWDNAYKSRVIADNGRRVSF